MNDPDHETAPPLETHEPARTRGTWSCGVLSGAAVASMVSGIGGCYSTPMGAGVAGKTFSTSTTWNLEPLVYALFGFAAGWVLFWILLVVLFREGGVARRILWAMVTAVFGAFFAGAVEYHVSRSNGARRSERAREVARAEASRHREYERQLREDPGIVVREKWYQESSGNDWLIKWNIFRDSLGDDSVSYEPRDLWSLANEQRGNLHIFPRIINRPEFDLERLELEFDLAFEDALEDSEAAGCRLAMILSAPRAKEEWIERVRASGIGDDPAVYWKRTLRETVDRRLGTE